MPLNESPKKPNQMGINQGFQVSCTFLLTFEPHPEVENNLTEAYFSYLSSKLSLFIKKKISELQVCFSRVKSCGHEILKID